MTNMEKTVDAKFANKRTAIGSAKIGVGKECTSMGENVSHVTLTYLQGLPPF